MSANFLNDPVKVLHLDDEPDLLMLTNRFIERYNRETLIKLDYYSIDNPLLIFDKLKNEKYDVIVADYEMPELNGLEVLDKLRNQSKNEIPFIIFTGRGREEVAIKALNLGANYYINKGLDAESQYHELFHAIQSVAKQKRMEKAFQENEENILADSLFDQLLINLFTNSVKNNKNEQVEIKVFSGYSENKKVRLSISDNGIGIENEKLEKMLDRYTQFRKDGKGSGLGLFIIKTLSYRYKGKLMVKNLTSNENTKGTCFEFEFPVVE